MNKEINVRILQFLKNVGLNRSKLADMLGMNKSTLISQMNGNRGISLEVLTKIFDAFPILNKDWVFTGQGKMTLVPDEGAEADTAYLAKMRSLQNEIQELRIKLREKDAQIDVLKSLIVTKK